MSSVAEETYCQLSDDVTCRASAVKSLVLSSCSSDMIQLMTALCSQLIHLQLSDCTQVQCWGVFKYYLYLNIKLGKKVFELSIYIPFIN